MKKTLGYMLLLSAVFTPKAWADNIADCEVLIAERVEDEGTGGSALVSSYRPAGAFLSSVYDDQAGHIEDIDGHKIRAVFCQRRSAIPTLRDFPILETGVALSLSQNFDSASSDLTLTRFIDGAFQATYSGPGLDPQEQLKLDDMLEIFNFQPHDLATPDKDKRDTDKRDTDTSDTDTPDEVALQPETLDDVSVELFDNAPTENASTENASTENAPTENASIDNASSAAVWSLAGEQNIEQVETPDVLPEEILPEELLPEELLSEKLLPEADVVLAAPDDPIATDPIATDPIATDPIATDPIAGKSLEALSGGAPVPEQILEEQTPQEQIPEERIQAASEAVITGPWLPAAEAPQESQDIAETSSPQLTVPTEAKAAEFDASCQIVTRDAFGALNKVPFSAAGLQNNLNTVPAFIMPLPAGLKMEAVECMRDTLTPGANDYKVARAGFAFFYIVKAEAGKGQRVAALEFVRGKYRMNLLEGDFTDQELIDAKARILSFNADKLGDDNIEGPSE